jgi:hypothetical protein
MTYWTKFEYYNSYFDDKNARVMHCRELIQRGEHYPVSRPESTGWCLADDVHDWFIRRGIPYQLTYAKDGLGDNAWRVGVDDPAYALLVKLTWSK